MANSAEAERDIARWKSALYDPLPGGSPDRVTPETVADEMASFMSLSGEVSGWDSG